jgi:hypothetical protein
MRQYSKAIAAAIGTGVATIGTALADGELTTPEIYGAAGLTLVGIGIVFGAPSNAPAAPTPPA